MMQRQTKSNDTDEDFRIAFRAFDKDEEGKNQYLNSFLRNSS